MSNNYFVDRNANTIKKLQLLKKKLPNFCTEFFVGIESNTTPLTRLNYAQDLVIFFDFLSKEISEFIGYNYSDFTYSDLDKITATHIEIFLDYLNHYEFHNQVFNNSAKTKLRKLSSVRALLRYFFMKDKIKSNITEKVKSPKIHDKEIIRLEVDEVSSLLNTTENGEFMTRMQKGFHKHTAERDLAMLTLFLGTGIRISECVGLNIDDIDFNTNAFTVTRKGGNRTILFMSDEVIEALSKYLPIRQKMLENNADEKALFLSLQNKRINVRTVEKLVKKYATMVSPLKKISPHKLRSTYGTTLYRETGDIYVVAEVLGHKDINTTKKHYAAISDDIKREASKKVKLR